MTVYNTYKSRYKMKKKEKKKRKYKCTREHKRNRTTLTQLTFYNIIKAIEHITFYITDRALTDH